MEPDFRRQYTPISMNIPVPFQGIPRQNGELLYESSRQGMGGSFSQRIGYTLSLPNGGSASEIMTIERDSSGNDQQRSYITSGDLKVELFAMGSWQSVTVTNTKNNQSYKIETINGKTDYLRIDGGVQHNSSREEVQKSVSNLLKDINPAWAPQITYIPENSPPAPTINNTTARITAKVQNIQTDGTCSIIAPVEPTNTKRQGNLYHKNTAGEGPATNLSAEFRPEAFFQGRTVIGDFRDARDPANLDKNGEPKNPSKKPLKDTMPDSVHQQLVGVLKGGGQIRVDYVDKVEGCPTTGAKPAAPSTQRRS